MARFVMSHVSREWRVEDNSRNQSHPFGFFQEGNGIMADVTGQSAMQIG